MDEEWKLWEEFFNTEEAALEDSLTGQTSSATNIIDQVRENEIARLMQLGYSRQAIEDYGRAWLQLTPLWEGLLGD